MSVSFQKYSKDIKSLMLVAKNKKETKWKSVDKTEKR